MKDYFLSLMRFFGDNSCLSKLAPVCLPNFLCLDIYSQQLELINNAHIYGWNIEIACHIKSFVRRVIHVFLGYFPINEDKYKFFILEKCKLQLDHTG